ncbi:AAA family ATPase [Helicobacter cetorum]|uniref:AAA family ATPase n=1 Tax=Helicobacter cetorum TaxID=138563 RepID=UPI000CF097D4|nr:AAA family ATPase [Helicobacter cetorum]
MKISSLSLKNFRSFKEVSINFDNLTTFVGKNDRGKSSILEALDIFFDPKKFSPKDVNVLALKENQNAEVTIGVTFEISDELLGKLKEFLDEDLFENKENKTFLNIKKVFGTKDNNNKRTLKKILINNTEIKQGKNYKLLEKHFPLYCLFVSDRKSDDDNNEVQNPINLALKDFLAKNKEVHKKLKEVNSSIKNALKKPIYNALEILKKSIKVL